MKRLRACAALLAASLSLSSTACIQPSRTIPSPPAGEWTTRLGSAVHAPFAQERVPARVRVEWDAGFDRGLPAVPIVHGDLIITAVSGGAVRTSSATTGGRYWSRRFRGSVAGQVLRAGDRLFFAMQHRDGTIYALDVARGRRLWSRGLGGRAATDPVHAGGMLYVSTDRGELFAIHAENGNVLWRVRVYATAAQPPVVSDGDLLIATTRDSLLRVDRRTGAVRSRLALGGTASAPLARSGDTLVVALSPGVVAAFSQLGARELWRVSAGAPVLAAPVVLPDGVFVLNRDADLLRIDAAGRVARLAELGGAATESLTATADGLLVGRLDGTLFFLRRDGTIVWREQVRGSVRAPAAVRDSSVYVATLAGRLIKLVADG